MIFSRLLQVIVSYIPNQCYNGTMFYFDYVFVRTHALGQLVHLNKSSFNLASKLTFVLTVCLKLFEKQTLH